MVAACQDPARAPIPLTVTAEPAAQTAGGVVTLTSEQFPELALLPSPDPLRPLRWTNFAILVGADTADSWRIGPTQIAFRVPPLLTGNYDVAIGAEGYDQARAALFVVGQAFPVYWGGLNAYTSVLSGTVFPSRGILIAETYSWPGFTTGYGLIDVQSRRLTMYPEFREGTRRVKMEAPGPSYRPNHFVFDLSPSGTAAATVWRADPWTVVDTLPCGEPLGAYAAAELSATTCLSLRFGTLVRNGVDTLGLFPSLWWGNFRLARNGKWAVVTTSSLGAFGGPLTWPVLDKSGTVVYTIDTLHHVTGAAFSTAGDTMYLTAGAPDPAATDPNEVRFALMALETATGRTIATRAFASHRVLQDVAVDPLRPLLYVGGFEREMTADGYLTFRQYLTVLHRETLDVVADMPATLSPSRRWVSDATLLHQAGAGRVSVVGWCGFDCGGLWVFTFDLP
ncbi:MAG: hypothetical protein Q8Q14_06905 [Gemmatimonadales bacterium]|nr:hypothetical protein [Gemmatimonadales bacterium]